MGSHTSSQPAFETPYNPWTKKKNSAVFFDLLSADMINGEDLITDIVTHGSKPNMFIKSFLTPLENVYK